MCSHGEGEKRFRAANQAPAPCCVRSSRLQPPNKGAFGTTFLHRSPYFARQYSRGSVSPLLQAGKMLSKYLGTARGADILGYENKEGRAQIRGPPRNTAQTNKNEMVASEFHSALFSEQAAPQLRGLGTSATSAAPGHRISPFQQRGATAAQGTGQVSHHQS